MNRSFYSDTTQIYSIFEFKASTAGEKYLYFNLNYYVL